MRLTWVGSDHILQQIHADLTSIQKLLICFVTRVGELKMEGSCSPQDVRVKLMKPKYNMESLLPSPAYRVVSNLSSQTHNVISSSWVINPNQTLTKPNQTDPNPECVRSGGSEDLITNLCCLIQLLGQ